MPDNENLADAAIAVCYPDDTTSESLSAAELLWTIRDGDHGEAVWTSGNLEQLTSVIRLAPAQLGNPDFAAAERIRELALQADTKSDLAHSLIEQVFSGYDVNLTATHMAATTLGLLSPTTQFRNMKIGRTLLGLDKNGKARLGSLVDFLSDSQPMLIPFPNAEPTARQVDTG